MADKDVDGKKAGEACGPFDVTSLIPTKEAWQNEEEVFLSEVGGLFSHSGDDKDDNDSPLYEVDPAFAPRNCKSGVLICLLCSFASPNPNTLKRHVCNHLKKQRFDSEKKLVMIMCLACGFENENNYVMAGHLRTHDKLVHSYMSLANKRTRVMGETRSPLPNYKCLLCDFQGSSANEVILHVKKQHQTEDFVCKICSLDCQTLHAFLEHKSEHDAGGNRSASVRPSNKNEENTLRCPLCSFSSFSMKDTLAHVESHNNVDVIACPSCNCRFHSSALLKDHLTFHDKGGTCPKCSAMSFRFSSFEGVVFCDSSSEPKRFHCTKCDFSTVRPSSMTRHLLRHTMPVTYTCDHCSFSSHHRSDIKEHSASCHKAPPEPAPESITYEWWCNDCSSAFNSAEEINDHIRNAHGAPIRNENEKVDLTCRQCGHQSSTVEEDKKHFMEHREKKKIRYVSKPYTPRGVFYCCMECDYQTKKVSSLKHHMSTHENFPRFLCTKCSRSFKTEDDYKVHELLMHKEQVLVCGECDSTLAPKEVYEHYTTNHPSKLPPQLSEVLGPQESDPQTRRDCDTEQEQQCSRGEK